MAWNPGPLIDKLRAAVLTGDKSNLAGGWPWNESANLGLIARIRNVIAGEPGRNGVDPVVEMRHRLTRELEGGLMGDELGSGYADDHIRPMLCLWRWCDMHRHELDGLVQRWLRAVLTFYGAHVVRHRDSVIVVTPGGRRRTPVSNFISNYWQAALGWPERIYGLQETDPPNRATYHWTSKGERLWIEGTVGMTVRRFTEGLGVPLSPANADLRDIRTSETRILVRYPSMTIASWIPELRTGDAPMPGVVTGGLAELPRVLQLQPQGPRGWKDDQWQTAGQVQRTWVENGWLHADLVGQRESPNRTRWPVERQTPSAPLPPSEPAWIVEFGPDHPPRLLDRLPSRSPAPQPPAPPAGGPPMPPPRRYTLRQQLAVEAVERLGWLHQGEDPEVVLQSFEDHYGVPVAELRPIFEGREKPPKWEG